MPKFEETFCSQCGKSFGPGDSGYSHCEDHDTRSRIKADHTRPRIGPVECPSCHGRGYTNPAFNCRWCEGTGVVSEEDAVAFGPEN